MMRALYTTIGTLALLLGVIGIVVPILPTTPFLLFAAFCYLRGSERMHTWLLSHPVLGPPIQSFQDGQGIRTRVKILAIAMMWLSLAVSAWVMPLPWARPFLLIPGILVTIYIVRLPTKVQPPAPRLDTQIR